MPTPIMRAYAELWTSWDEELDDIGVEALNRIIGLETSMMSEIARINPRDATEYVSEVLRRSGHSVAD